MSSRSAVIVRAALAGLALGMVPAAVQAQRGEGPFTSLAGSWSGGGSINLSEGGTERIRCRATYAPEAGGDATRINLRCASDSYNFDMSSQVRVRDGLISGTWSEASKGVSGSVSGRATPGSIQAQVHGPFAASLTVSTSGNRQTIAIRSEGTDLTGASISLNRGR